MDWHDEAQRTRFVCMSEGPVEILFLGEKVTKERSSFAKEGEDRFEWHFQCSSRPGQSNLKDADISDEWAEDQILSVSSRKLLAQLDDISKKTGKPNLEGVIVEILRRGYGKNTTYSVGIISQEVTE